MRGRPVTRATSPGGRWAYTFYDGAGGHPFVHALDVVGRTARCVDLHLLAGRGDLANLRLALVGKLLAVRKGGRTLAAIDTETFAVATPRVAQPPGGGRGEPWLLVALGLAAAAVLYVAARRFAARSQLRRIRPLPGRIARQ